MIGGDYAHVGTMSASRHRNRRQRHREPTMTHGLGRKMRLGAYVALAALAVSCMAPAAAENTFEENVALFRLFANCRPMNLSVALEGPDALETGLTEESIRASVESRLRSARLYDATISPYLHAHVHIYKNAFSVTLKYFKWVHDEYSQLHFHATTWEQRSIGTHTGDGVYIHGALSQFTDEFLVEFLRVNEEACAKR